MLAHSAKIPPTPAPTHASTGFILSGMKAICKQNQCGCQAGGISSQRSVVEDGGEDRGERVHSFRHRGNLENGSVRDGQLGQLGQLGRRQE